MRRINLLAHRHRFPASNLALGMALAFNAGAINAGGFLVLHLYTSHMTGFASQLADGAVLGHPVLWLHALGAILSFICGAAVCAILVNWGRRHRLHGVFALPLVLEAVLMLCFGFLGAWTLTWQTPFAVPTTVLLLSFMMGLQNAVASKTSGGSVRTTHMTGNITDIGMELGKLVYWNRAVGSEASIVRHNPARLRFSGGLVLMFVVGGVVGALGFKHLGFMCVVPLASLLLAISLPTLLRDGPRLVRRARRRLRAR